MRNYIIILIVSVLFLFVSWMYTTQIDSDTSSTIDNEDVNEQTDNEEEIKGQTTSPAATETIQEAAKKVTGFDQDRVDHDTEIVQEFLRKIMTWSSYDEYMNIRQSIMDDYNIDEDSNFLTTFMPFVVNAVAANGDAYNRIDMYGLNVTYESIEPHVISIYLNEYSYFSIVTYSSTDENGSEAENNVIFMYTIDNDGNLSDLNAYPLAI